VKKGEYEKEDFYYHNGKGVAHPLADEYETQEFIL